MSLFFIFSLFSSASSFAASTYVVDPAGEVHGQIGYTLGTHEIYSTTPQGQLTLPGKSVEQLYGELYVNVTDIHGDGDKLTCHLWESLGLDYKVSDFPDSHVCEGNQLPKNGKNSIAFPKVTLHIDSLTKMKDDRYSVVGSWIIHGVTQPISGLLVELKQEVQNLTITGDTTLSLKTFGVVVKPAFVISVQDEVKLRFKLKLKLK